MMQNHPRLPESTPREWQIAAKKQVNEIIKLVLHTTRVRVDYAILYVANPLRGRNSGQTIYNVRLNSVEASKRIRDLYSGFFKKNSPVKLPSSLKGISIRNKVTHETRVRIAILRQLGINYEARNPGGSYQLRGYDSRPLLLTFPPSGDSGSRPRTFNFIQAVTSLPTELSDTNLAYIHQVLGTRNPGQLQAIYVVLRDDDRERCDALVVQHRASQRGLSGQSVGPSATSSRTLDLVQVWLPKHWAPCFSCPHLLHQSLPDQKFPSKIGLTTSLRKASLRKCEGFALGRDLARRKIEGPALGRDLARRRVEGPALGRDLVHHALSVIGGPVLGLVPVHQLRVAVERIVACLRLLRLLARSPPRGKNELAHHRLPAQVHPPQDLPRHLPSSRKSVKSFRRLETLKDCSFY